jgi:hypothetical protein
MTNGIKPICNFNRQAKLKLTSFSPSPNLQADGIIARNLLLEKQLDGTIVIYDG